MAAQVMLFFLAGFDAASTLLCFTAHQLATHPDIQSRLQEEIDTTLDKDRGKLTYEAVQTMKYLDMVVSGTVQKPRILVVPYHEKWLAGFPDII
jgi:cytochrome P450 family 9